MKHRTVIVPLALPVLTDKAAVQLIDLLHELAAAVEHQYAAQAHRYERRHRAEPQSARFLSPDEPPFGLSTASARIAAAIGSYRSSSFTPPSRIALPGEALRDRIEFASQICVRNQR